MTVLPPEELHTLQLKHLQAQLADSQSQLATSQLGLAVASALLRLGLPADTKIDVHTGAITLPPAPPEEPKEA